MSISNVDIRLETTQISEETFSLEEHLKNTITHLKDFLKTQLAGPPKATKKGLSSTLSKKFAQYIIDNLQIDIQNVNVSLDHIQPHSPKFRIGTSLKSFTLFTTDHYYQTQQFLNSDGLCDNSVHKLVTIDDLIIYIIPLDPNPPSPTPAQYSPSQRKQISTQIQKMSLFIFNAKIQIKGSKTPAPNEPALSVKVHIKKYEIQVYNTQIKMIVV